MWLSIAEARVSVSAVFDEGSTLLEIRNLAVARGKTCDESFRASDPSRQALHDCRDRSAGADSADSGERRDRAPSGATAVHPSAALSSSSRIATAPRGVLRAAVERLPGRGYRS